MELIYKEHGKNYILNREEKENAIYIANCAALSFHKSLVGISELKALESVKDFERAGGLRISRALSTYYSIYHLFVTMMLLDKTFNIKLKYNRDKFHNGRVNMGVNVQDLNTGLETPEAWSIAGKLEQDLATSITHGSVKAYCCDLREKESKLTGPYKLLYDYFIKEEENPNKSVKGLFEKVCYIRDRSVYRPSIVYSEEGGMIHTSKDIRKEIESLPSSEELLGINKEIIRDLRNENRINVKKAIQDKLPLNTEAFLLNNFFVYFIEANFSEEVKNVKKLGYTDEDIEKFKYKNSEIPSFKTHITHLMELVDRERLQKDHDEIWMDLL